MKFLLIISILILFGNQLYAQTKKNSLTTSGILSHYIHKQNYREDTWGYYTYPVDPGYEILYFREVGKSVSVGTGYCYQNGRIASAVNGKRRFHFKEKNVPILIRKEFSSRAKTYWFASTGLYIGKNKTIRAESLGKYSGWNTISDMERVANYYDDNNFIDLYCDSGYFYLLNKWSEISFSAFVKYRANSIWLNYHQKKSHYGIKLSYSLKF